MKPQHSLIKQIIGMIAVVSCFSLSAVRAGTAMASDKAAKAPVPVEANWLDETVTPVTNPVFFEDPVIRTEVRPIFAYHRIDGDFITQGGHAEVYAMQLRYAVTDRLAIIATEDGYMNIHPGVGSSFGGWLDLAAGFKYALIDDRANHFILTPGLTFTIPTGEKSVFNGGGSGQWNVFTSAEKGIGNLHLLANIGVRVPNDTNRNSTELHYSLHVDYYVSRWFIPFVEANGWTILARGHNLPLDSEGYDVINFGSANADHATQFTIGGGFRTRLYDHTDFGFAYEKAIVKPYGLTDDRFTFDVTIRF